MNLAEMTLILPSSDGVQSAIDAPSPDSFYCHCHQIPVRYSVFHNLLTKYSDVGKYTLSFYGSLNNESK